MISSLMSKMAAWSLAGTLVLAACGAGSEVAAEVAPTPEPAPTVTAAPTATEVPQPTATAVPQPTATAVPEPTPTAVPEPTPTAVPATEGETPVAEATAEPVAVDGAAVFSSTCAFCHGAAGTGTDRAPSLQGIGQFFVPDASPLVNLVMNGGEKMPEFGTKLSPAQIGAVVQYVVANFQ